MAAITVLVEEIRGEQAPPERYDMRARGDRLIGNPNSPHRPHRHEPGEDPT
jgi:hypothetical protein